RPDRGKRHRVGERCSREGYVLRAEARPQKVAKTGESAATRALGRSKSGSRLRPARTARQLARRRLAAPWTTSVDQTEAHSAKSQIAFGVLVRAGFCRRARVAWAAICFLL